MERPLLPAGEMPLVHPRLIDISFFALGTASDITFNSLVMTVSYLRAQFGNDVLARVARAQFMGASVTMMVLFLWALYSPRGITHSLRMHTMTLKLGISYLLLLDMTFFVIAGLDLPFAILSLDGLIGFCGIATGLSQSLVAMFSGLMTSIAQHPTAASAHVSGVGLGITLPTVTQVALLPLMCSESRKAGLSYIIAACFSLAGIVALARLRCTAVFGRLEYGGIDEIRAGTGTWFEQSVVKIACVRLSQVAIPSIGLMISCGALVFCGLVTPFLSPQGTILKVESLPTLLLGVTNSFDFIGRLLALRVVHLIRHRGGQFMADGAQPQGLMFLVSLLLLRLLPAFAIQDYCAHGPPAWAEGSDALLFSLYAIGSFIGGILTVFFTQQAQSRCMMTGGPNMDTCTNLPCPLAGQIMVLAIVIGCFLGSMLPMPSKLN